MDPVVTGDVTVHHHLVEDFGITDVGTANRGPKVGLGGIHHPGRDQDQVRDLVQDHFLQEVVPLDAVEEADLPEGAGQEDPLSVAVPLAEAVHLDVVPLAEVNHLVAENPLEAEAAEAVLPEGEAPEDVNKKVKS